MSTITYGNVVLRPWTPQDAQALIAIAQCGHVQQWLKDWSDVQLWAAPWIEGQIWRHQLGDPVHEFMSWAITTPANDTPIGVINLGGDEMEHQAVSIGYFLHKDALHQGYATQAVRALTRYAFDRWGFAQICATVRVENKASQAVLERAGFTAQRVIPMHLSGYDKEVPCFCYVLKPAS